MKKNKVLLIVLLIMLTLCTACGEKKVEDSKKGTHVETKEVEKKEEEVKKKTFVCDNKYVQIEANDSWANYPGKDKMNKDSCLELVGVNKNEEKYLLIISEDKKAFKDFNAWFDVVFGMAKKSYQLDENQVRRSDENGLNTRFVEKDLEVQGERVYLQLYFMETNKYYSQVLVWTDQEHKASLSSEFRDMAYSLKEVE